MHFIEIKTAIAQQFERMAPHPLFRTGIDKDLMWGTYLAAFPEGTNPIFRTRTEHDCSCCRHFIRTVGDVVAIIDGELASIWDIATPNSSYLAVAERMSALVKALPIDNVFLHTEGAVGTDQNHEKVGDDMVRTWDHFHVRLPNSRVVHKDVIGQAQSEARAQHDVLLRSLMEITREAVTTVLDLIAANALYRGEEHQYTLTTFRDLKAEFMATAPLLGDGARSDRFVWSKIAELSPAVSKIRNTSIGTLLTEISEGMDLDRAVSRFEAMVAPSNYKRPTALVTPAMVAKAKTTVEELGLTSALDRRYAHLTDITVNNVLYADRSARKAMAGGAFDGIAAPVPMKPQAFDKAQEMPVEEFLATVLPEASSLELLMEGRHTGNLVSLIAPVDPAAGQLFKWDNRFSWSYKGDVADSMKERVKKAGGNVTGDLCCRLAWFNRDDLDFHMQEPGGEEIYFGHPTSRAGFLDVDMNVHAETREPVENIAYPNATLMREGYYRLFVHQFTKREVIDVGFEVEIDWRGTVHRFAYAKSLRDREAVVVAELQYSRAAGLDIISSLPATAASRKVWNIDTETFQRVSVVMLSPNHWDGHGVGNRHYFWMLAGCENDGTARGFYNEFLRGDLDQHRKVFELVGARMRTEETTDQLSGLGFSSTQRNNALVRVGGTRVVRVTF